MIMKIVPIVENTFTNIKKTSTRLSNAGRNGYHIALRNSKIHKQNEATTLLNIGRCVSKNMAKETTVDDLPIIGGALGMLVPIPFLSPILLGIGKIVQVVYNRLHKA